MKINRCGLLCATVTGPSLSVCRKHAHQVCSLLYKLSNSITYEWPSLLTCSTVVPYLKFSSFTYSNLSTLVIKGQALRETTQCLAFFELSNVKLYRRATFLETSFCGKVYRQSCACAQKQCETIFLKAYKKGEKFEIGEMTKIDHFTIIITTSGTQKRTIAIVKEEEKR